MAFLRQPALGVSATASRARLQLIWPSQPKQSERTGHGACLFAGLARPLSTASDENKVWIDLMSFFIEHLG